LIPQLNLRKEVHNQPAVAALKRLSYSTCNGAEEGVLATSTVLAGQCLTEKFIYLGICLLALAFGPGQSEDLLSGKAQGSPAR